MTHAENARSAASKIRGVTYALTLDRPNVDSLPHHVYTRPLFLLVVLVALLADLLWIG
ncbi:hypothetical protein ABIA16_001118 [Sinorhizobium fredii]